MAVTDPNNPYANLFAPSNPITGQPLYHTQAAPSASPASAPTAIDQYKNPLDDYADLASIVGSAGSGAQANRLIQGDFTQNYDKLMLDAAANKRADEADALKKLSITSYLGNGGSHFKPGNISLNGKDYQLSDFGMGPLPASQAQMDAAHQLEDTVQKRLQPGGSYEPQPLDSYAKPGTLEQISNWGVPAIMGFGALDKLLGGKLTGGLETGVKKLFGGGNASNVTAGASSPGNFSNSLDDAENAASSGAFNPTTLAGGGGAAAFTPGVLSGFSDAAPNISSLTPTAIASMTGGLAPLASSVPGSVASNAYNAGMFTGPGATSTASNLAGGGAGSIMNTLMSKGIPAAGAAYSAYQLAKNKSKSSDIMSGAGTGAGIGTMIMPGVGTAIGAGIGALGGLARHAWGGPDQVEQAARKSSGSAIDQLTSGATPAEQAEAAKAGWKDPNQALALISLRDKLQAQGKDPAMAGTLMQQLLSATSQSKNPKAVAQAVAQIQSALG